MQMHLNMETDLIFYLLGIIILLSLIAAVGAWRRPPQLTRDEAEDLFATSHERNAAEAQRLRESVTEAQRASADKLIALRAETQELLGGMSQLLEHTAGELRGTLTQATEQQEESIRKNLGDLSSNVTAALTEAKRSQDAGIEKVEGTLQQVRTEVDRASTEVKTSIVELQRQHNEAKAQSAIQLCEALISSLGTLRNTIAGQIAESRHADILLPNQEFASDQAGPQAAPDGPQDQEYEARENQVPS
ncbi:MAG: hypothetical protein ACR2IE_00905 [Candidatus Sumerlaeaceae bacterium]